MTKLHAESEAEASVEPPGRVTAAELPTSTFTQGKRFVQEGFIASGGHGNLYLGRDTQTGQQVAIKRLKPELFTQRPDLIARLMREGKALQQLNHPNIVKIIAVQEQAGEQAIIMEYVPGGSLADLLKKEDQLAIDRVLAITLELADALSHAHHLGIIHRDLKPDNVLLATDGTPRLTDFGIALMSQQDTRLTQEGAFMGSPRYMSPEACRGEEVDHRADIWSFGALLYEMLSGQPPFAEELVTAVLVAILNNPVPDLSQFRANVPEPLISLINQMLAKEQTRRINSMRLVAAKLEEIHQNTNNGA